MKASRAVALCRRFRAAVPLSAGLVAGGVVGAGPAAALEFSGGKLLLKSTSVEIVVQASGSAEARIINLDDDNLSIVAACTTAVPQSPACDRSISWKAQGLNAGESLKIERVGGTSGSDQCFSNTTFTVTANNTPVSTGSTNQPGTQTGQCPATANKPALWLYSIKLLKDGSPTGAEIDPTIIVPKYP